MSSFSRRETGVLGTIELYSGRAATEQLRGPAAVSAVVMVEMKEEWT